MKKSLNIILTLLVLFAVLFVEAKVTKNRKIYLRQQIEKSKKDIEYADALLNLNAKDKKISVNKLRIISRKIDLRERLINELSEEIIILESRIFSETEKIEFLKVEIELLKEQYRNSVKLAYKYNKKNNSLIHLLSSDNVEQLYRRLIYFKTYTKDRKNQARSLVLKSNLLEKKIKDLELQRQRNLSLLDQKNEEKFQLQQEKKKKRTYISDLNSRKKSLQKEIAYKQRRINRLNREIERIIKQEIAEEKARLAKLAKQNKSKHSEVKELSEAFSTNKGRLPQPVNGVIISKFGKHRHPIVKSIFIENSGIDIKTKERSDVKTCFGGVVKKIFAIPGKNKAVIVRHGEFLTVYSNLKRVFVNVGQKLKRGQKLGKVASYNGDSVLHFEIWNETKKLNPEEWINL